MTLPGDLREEEESDAGEAGDAGGRIGAPLDSVLFQRTGRGGLEEEEAPTHGGAFGAGEAPEAVAALEEADGEAAEASGVAMEAGGVAKSETGVSGDLDGRLGGGGGGVGSPFVGVLRSKGVAWVDSHHEQRVTWSSAGE